VRTTLDRILSLSVSAGHEEGFGGLAARFGPDGVEPRSQARSDPPSDTGGMTGSGATSPLAAVAAKDRNPPRADTSAGIELDYHFITDWYRPRNQQTVAAGAMRNVKRPSRSAVRRSYRNTPERIQGGASGRHYGIYEIRRDRIEIERMACPV
jgi:hypothetical protein